MVSHNTILRCHLYLYFEGYPGKISHQVQPFLPNTMSTVIGLEVVGLGNARTNIQLITRVTTFSVMYLSCDSGYPFHSFSAVAHYRLIFAIDGDTQHTAQ